MLFCTSIIFSSFRCVLLDAFCGCGGNAISFAKRPSNEISLVIAVDKDRDKLRKAANNAKIYGISIDKIIFIEADAIRIMKTCYLSGKLIMRQNCYDNVEQNCILSTQNQSISNVPTTELCHGYKIGGIQNLPSTIDAIFLSPPWGGPNYMDVGTCGFEIKKHIRIHSEEKMIIDSNESGTVQLPQDCAKKINEEVTNGEMLLKISSKATTQQNVIFFLPKNINGIELGKSALEAGYKGVVEMEQNVMNGKTKTVTAYFGDCWSSSFES